MSTPLLCFVAAIYVGVAVSEFRDGNRGMTLVWVAYAISILGFIWSKFE